MAAKKKSEEKKSEEKKTVRIVDLDTGEKADVKGGATGTGRGGLRGKAAVGGNAFQKVKRPGSQPQLPPCSSCTN